ncbi:MAG: hypothetical protein PHX83_00280 [Acidobacteriia bacterium]|nr:hypothetical protein [Terriglobia bacterium]
MKRNRFLKLAIGLGMAILLGWGTLCVALSSPEPPQKPAQPQVEPGNPPVPPASMTPTPEPEINPDVKQWFLEKNPPRKPFDPHDVDVLTGKTRAGDQPWPIWNSGVLAPLDPMGFPSRPFGRWNSPFPRFFATPRFFLFGGARFNQGGFFFGSPLFRPFGSGRNFGHFGFRPH